MPGSEGMATVAGAGEAREEVQGRRGMARRRALSLNMARAFSLTAMFFWCMSRRIMGLGASRRSHLSCWAKARSERPEEKLSQ